MGNDSVTLGAPTLWMRSLTIGDESRALTALLLRVRTDQAAFAQLYDLTSTRVYGLILRVLRDPGYAEETTQEVFLQIWRTCEKYDPDRGSALAWMLTLAHRRAVDRVRSEQASTTRERATSTNERDRDEVIESVLDRVEQAEVRHCLQTLTALQSEALSLAYYGGRSYREVAIELEVATATVKSRIRDGLLRLKMCLGVRSS